MSMWERVITQLFARLDGPMHFRFIMQPLMAAILATIDGVKDGRAGKPAYLWEMLSTAADRKQLLREGWKRVSRVFFLAVILDVDLSTDGISLGISRRDVDCCRRVGDHPVFSAARPDQSICEMAHEKKA